VDGELALAAATYSSLFLLLLLSGGRLPSDGGISHGENTMMPFRIPTEKVSLG
jgi:hypothetical protein